MSQVKNQKTNKFTAIIVSVMVAFALAIVAVFIAYSLCTIKNSALKILFSIGVGFTTQCILVAISLVVIAIVFKYKLGYVIAPPIFLAGLLVLFILCNMEAWVIVILMAGLSLIAFLSSFLAYRSKLILIADNEMPDYKDYKTRKAEEDAQKKDEEQLPEVKSFKE